MKMTWRVKISPSVDALGNSRKSVLGADSILFGNGLIVLISKRIGQNDLFDADLRSELVFLQSAG